MRNVVESIFAEYGITPREVTKTKTQLDLCVYIVDKFINHGIKNVILKSPVGSGKSVIGAVVAESLIRLTDKSKQGFLVTPTKYLTNQYKDTFQGYSNVCFAKGAGSYPCNLHTTKTRFHTADHCTVRNASLNGCPNCEYATQERELLNKRIIVTNDHFLSFNEKKTMNGIIGVFDEAHLLPDAFCEMNRYKMTMDMVKEIKTLCDKLSVVYKNIMLDDLRQIRGISNKIDEHAREFVGNNYTVFNKMYYSKLSTLLQTKTLDILCKNIEHVVHNENKTEYSLVLPKQAFNLGFKYNLFMSGTIDEKTFPLTLGLDPSETLYININYKWNKENKKVYYYKDNKNINKKLLDKPEELELLHRRIADIVVCYEDNGLILLPSYKMCEDLYNFLLNYDGVPHNLKVQSKDATAIDLVTELKDSKNMTLLISPSMYEGVDLKDDLCRFIIIPKIPYGYLGDFRVKSLLEDYPSVYANQALTTVIQGTGRGVRNEDDYCDIHILDSNFLKLDWKKYSDEFSLVEYDDVWSA